MNRPEALAPALAAVRGLLADRPTGRLLVGIAGPPGAGKSTLASALVAALAGGSRCPVLVPMDGFHLANAELRRLGLTQRKGAPETFDAAGFVELLRRLRNQREEIVYAPVYSRTLHESIGGAIPIPAEVRLIVVEGNYLLLDVEPWAGVRGLLDLAVYLDATERTRRDGLIRRQLSRGLDLGAATTWVESSDEVNARVVAASRDRADLIIRRRSGQPTGD